MKCKDCIQSYVHLDTSCCWTAQCNLLGSAQGIGDCKMGANCNEDTDCDDQDPPEWDCDLGQSNRYCIHHAANTKLLFS